MPCKAIFPERIESCAEKGLGPNHRFAAAQENSDFRPCKGTFPKDSKPILMDGGWEQAKSQLAGSLGFPTLQGPVPERIQSPPSRKETGDQPNHSFTAPCRHSGLAQKTFFFCAHLQQTPAPLATRKPAGETENALLFFFFFFFFFFKSFQLRR